LLTVAKQNWPQNKAVWKTAESSRKRAGFGRRRKRMSGGGEAQMRWIVDYGRLMETKRKKDPISRSFKRRNIENHLPGTNFLRFPNSQSTHHTHIAFKTHFTSFLSTNYGYWLQFWLILELRLRLRLRLRLHSWPLEGLA
jgi:hypothetical protein